MGACDWSNPFTIDTVGATQAVEIVGEGFCFEAVMLVSLGPGRFSSTKVFTLLPRYIVVNKLDQPVQIGQAGCEESCPTIIGTGELQVVRWLDESKDRSLRIKLLPGAASGHEDWEWQWSDAMSRNTVGYFALKLRAKKLRPDGSPRVFNLALQVSLQGACTVIVIRQQDPSCPAIQIHNTSSWASVAYRQAGIDSDLEERSLPGVPTGYCWDRQQGPNVLSLRVTPRDQGVGVGELDCNMDRLGTFPILKVPHEPCSLALQPPPQSHPGTVGLEFLQLMQHGHWTLDQSSQTNHRGHWTLGHRIILEPCATVESWALDLGRKTSQPPRATIHSTAPPAHCCMLVFRG